MKVYILFGSDDYISNAVLDVFDSRVKAEEAIQQNKSAELFNDMRYKLISRQGEPSYKIEEHEVLDR